MNVSPGNPFPDFRLAAADFVADFGADGQALPQVSQRLLWPADGVEQVGQVVSGRLVVAITEPVAGLLTYLAVGAVYGMLFE